MSDAEPTGSSGVSSGRANRANSANSAVGHHADPGVSSDSGQSRWVRWRDRAVHLSRQPRVRRGVLVGFLLLVAVLLFRGAQAVPWPEVWQALKDTPAWRLAAAVGLAALGYALYGSFDLIGRRMTGHRVSTPAVLRVATVSYGLNQNLGYLLGGLGLRLRLYGALGLKPAVVGGVAGAAVLTNWLGHFGAFGVLLVIGDEPLPAAWGVSRGWWTALGALALLLVAAYLAACVFSPRREWQWGSLTLKLPRLRMAVLQVLAGSLSWMLMAAVLWVAMPEGASFMAIAAAVQVAAIAGALSHVPAGMGVLEAVLVALLSPRWPAHEVLAGVLVYRAAYQWLPGALAGVALALFEHGQRGGGAHDQPTRTSSGKSAREPEPPSAVVKAAG